MTVHIDKGADATTALPHDFRVPIERPDRLLRERIKDLRIAAGFRSHEQFAEQLQHQGWTNATMQKVQLIEAGRRDIQVRELGVIARALDIEVLDLMGGLGYIGNSVVIQGTTARARAEGRPGNT